jgi:excisionase family DNA binding protein
MAQMLETPWLTVDQLADRLHTTVAAVYKQRHLGKMPTAVKAGRALLFHRDDVERWEAKQREAASA